MNGLDTNVLIRFLVADERSMPTGAIRSVKDTPLDFRQMTAIGARIGAQAGQTAKGFDHNYVLNHKAGESGLAARVYEPTTGRVMEVFTTEPDVVFYTSNSFDGSIIGKGGQAYIRYAGLCLETQHFPDSPNKPQFPSTTLKQGATYRSMTVYKFATK